MKEYQNRAILAVRLLAVFFFLFGIWLLLANVIESVAEFNPTYFLYYFKSQLLRPSLACGLSILLYLSSAKVGRWISKDLY
jgi:hypothetical protein